MIKKLIKFTSLIVGMLVLTIVRHGGNDKVVNKPDYRDVFSELDTLFSTQQAHAETPLPVPGYNSGCGGAGTPNNIGGGPGCGDAGCGGGGPGAGCGGDGGGPGADAGDGCGDGPCSCF